MKIAWIEDFGGGTNPSADLLSALFLPLVEDDGIFLEWAGVRRLKVAPDTLEKFFQSHHLLHEVSLFTNYDKFLHATINEHPHRFDCLLIDINLEQDASIPSGIDPRTAGLALYNRTIREGYPPSRVAFVTGNSNEAEDFRKAFPKQFPGIGADEILYFEKSIDHPRYKEYSLWLTGIATDRYVRLRRGVLDGTREVRIAVDQGDRYRFPAFFKRAAEAPSVEDFKQFLTGLEAAHFPAVQKGGEAGRIAQFHALLTQVLHPWEGTASHMNLLENREEAGRGKGVNGLSDQGERWACRFATMLRSARNAVSHPTTQEAKEENIAFIFLAWIRTIIVLDNNLLAYERSLLNLLPSSSDDELTIHRDAMSKAFQRVASKIVATFPKYDAKDPKERGFKQPFSPHFSTMSGICLANRLIRDPWPLLYQHLWLVEGMLDQRKSFENLGRGEFEPAWRPSFGASHSDFDLAETTLFFPSFLRATFHNAFLSSD